MLHIWCSDTHMGAPSLTLVVWSWKEGRYSWSGNHNIGQIAVNVSLHHWPDPQVAIMGVTSMSPAATFNTSRVASADLKSFVSGSMSRVNGRLTEPLMWPDVISATKASGVNVKQRRMLRLNWINRWLINESNITTYPCRVYAWMHVQTMYASMCVHTGVCVYV